MVDNREPDIFDPEIRVSESELEDLTVFIQDNFDCFGSVKSVYRVDEGVNQKHYLAKTSGEKEYGLKVCTRNIRKGTDKEKAIADVGMVVNPPNCCKVEQYGGISELPGLKDQHKVNVIEWLPNADCLKRVDENEVKESSTSFFTQYGEWVYFALTFGVIDRHSGNWVWNSEENKLSMIDNQDSFREIKPARVRPALIVDRFSDIDRFMRKESDFPDLESFLGGIERMNRKVNSRREKLKETLNSWSFLKDYQSIYFDMDFPKAKKNILNCF